MADTWRASVGDVGLGWRTYPSIAFVACSNLNPAIRICTNARILLQPMNAPSSNVNAPSPVPNEIQAVIFDKDGTLVDFHTTWDASLGRTLEKMLGHDALSMAELATGLGFDLASGTISNDSPFVADSAEMLSSIIGRYVNPADFEATLIAEGALSVQPMAGASETLKQLRSLGLKLGVATNDAESSAVAQLDGLGWAAMFDCVVGYDSGYTSKPSPKMVLGCCHQLGVDPGNAIMVGDTATDMRAARSAGVVSVALGTDPGAVSLADFHIVDMAQLLSLINI